MGFGAAIVVAVMVVAAITLLPALIGFAGHNIDRFGIPGMKPRSSRGARDDDGRYHGWARWAHHVSRHPVALPDRRARASCSLLAAPCSHAPRPDRRGQNPTSSTLRRSYDLLAEGFGPGFNGPLCWRSTSRATTRTRRRACRRSRQRVAADPDVAAGARRRSRPER